MLYKLNAKSKRSDIYDWPKQNQGDEPSFPYPLRQNTKIAIKIQHIVFYLRYVQEPGLED